MSMPIAVLDRLLEDVRPAASPEPPAPTHRRQEPGRRPRATRSQVRQLVVGLLALPLTALPFVAYATMTPEGRLVRDRALVALRPPTLPDLSPREVGAAAAAAPRYDGAVMALAYHGIGSASDGEGGFVISATRFGEHLATLKAAGMNTVTAAQVAAAFSGGEPLPPNAVMLSFDDGRADAMMFADPLLAQAGMSATMFVIAGAASKPGIYYASWDRIEGYARSGRWDIQSHTAGSHREHNAGRGESLPTLTSLKPGESLEDYRARIGKDLADASAAIESHTGHAPVAFAYPFGAYGADRTNDPAIATVLREEVARHHAVAFQQDDQDTVPLLTADLDLLRLRRVEVQNWTGMELLRRIDQSRSATTPDAPPGTPVAAPPPSEGAAPSPLPEGAAPEPPGSSGSPATPSTIVTREVSPVPAGARPQAAGITPPTVAPSPVATVPTVPSVSTLPPPTTAPPPTVSPPTTVRPATTTSTSPPTTVCRPLGNSGKCARA